MTTKEVFDAIKHDREVEKEYHAHWTKQLMIVTLIDLAFLVGIYLERKSDTLWSLSVLWGIALEIAATCMLLFINFGSSDLFILSDGSSVRGDIFKKIIYYTLSFVPLYLCCYYRFNFSAVKSLYMAPVVLLVAIGLAMFRSLPVVGYSKGDKMTVQDMATLRRTLEMAGIDSHKIPPTVLGSSVKSMTVMDWVNVKRTAELAGYHLGYGAKKRRKR